MASPRTNACEASNYPWEKPEAAPKGCRGLTQIEFDAANMRGTGAVGKGMEKILPSRSWEARPLCIRQFIHGNHENIHTGRLSRHAAHAQCFRQTGRP